jgi:hypothetical protein
VLDRQAAKTWSARCRLIGRVPLAPAPCTGTASGHNVRSAFGRLNDRAVGVTGHVEDSEQGPIEGEPREQRWSARSRHDHVGEEHVDAIGVLAEQVFGLPRIRGIEHAVASPSEQRAAQQSDGVVVLDDEDGLRPRRRRFGFGRRALDDGPFSGARQIHFESPGHLPPRYTPQT